MAPNNKDTVKVSRIKEFQAIITNTELMGAINLRQEARVHKEERGKEYKEGQ